jgi:hypothetical protein
MAVRTRGEDEDGEEVEVTPPLHSPSHDVLPLLGDIFSRQAGIVVSTRWPKWPRTQTVDWLTVVALPRASIS